MPVFPAISRAAVERGLQFVVIGAHAVMRHGYVRATDDADILVCKEARQAWIDLASSLSYQLERDGGTFLQFAPAEVSDWNLDIMLVPRETFRSLLAEAKPETIEGTAILIPKLDHLLALKLHALKHGAGQRQLKDMDDVVHLLLANRVDVRSESFRQLCEKHGEKKIYDDIARAFAQ